MQISKKIPFDDPNVLNGVRALYIVSNLIIAGIYLYVQAQINKKNGACGRHPEKPRRCDCVLRGSTEDNKGG
jgi:uncharacterized membrane protein